MSIYHLKNATAVLAGAYLADISTTNDERTKLSGLKYIACV